MDPENPLLKYPVGDFYSGVAQKAAQAIRDFDAPSLAALLVVSPDIAKSRGLRKFPLLAWAMGHDNKEAFRMLLEAGASPDEFLLVNETRMSLLSIATGAEKSDYFDLLLSSQANPNGLPETEPPLFTAFYADKSERFERLLEAGANINHALGTGTTIVMSVALDRDYRRVLRLAEQGADLDVQMTNGTNLRKIIEKFPLPTNSEQGQAQQKVKALLK